MQTLTGKRILLGISGGIAAYKSADLCRRLIEVGAQVQVVMTPAAETFITPLTLQALSGRPVRSALLDPAAEAGMGHIELARWADLILIAPASADLLARLAHGLADDLLTTLCLASDRPQAYAPAMNRLMWQHPATRDNCELLRARGALLWGPGSGEQACGETGDGRMLEPTDLRARVVELFRQSASHRGQDDDHDHDHDHERDNDSDDGAEALTGRRVLITAGPTREAIDPVRFISNHSSGKMGYAIAAAAAAAGAEVTLVSGPTRLEPPPGVDRIDVLSAAQMFDAVMTRADAVDIFIAVAAVADYRIDVPAESKIKKSENLDEITLTLVRNPDILASVAALPTARRPFCVGFAAETDDVRGYAQRKLEQKNLDMIAANRVGVSDGGFDSDRNALQVLWRDGGAGAVLPSTDKRRLGAQLVALIGRRYRQRDGKDRAR